MNGGIFDSDGLGVSVKPSDKAFDATRMVEEAGTELGKATDSDAKYAEFNEIESDSVKVTAINLAAIFEPADVGKLLEDARTIEAYLRG